MPPIDMGQKYPFWRHIFHLSEPNFNIIVSFMYSNMRLWGGGLGWLTRSYL